MEKEKSDIFDRVTNLIVEAIEAGAGEFRLPWHVTGRPHFRPVNAGRNRPYRGVNVLALWAAAEARGYDTGVWATYHQWQELGAQVRKGEKSTPVVLWKVTDRGPTSEADDDTATAGGMFAVGYAVFNAAQVEGYHPPAPEPLTPGERVAEAEAFFAGVGADVRQEGEAAYYESASDIVRIPPFAAFREPAGYYSVLGHELTHWTGAAHRLNRTLATRFGSEAYAMEELVAELGAAFLCSALGLSNEPRPDHAAYLASWLRVLQQDKRAIFTAASKAQQAVDFLTAASTAEHARAA